ncbi:hypothetical protein DAD63_03085 [Streptococcus agalactiae]|uniref:Uncharacterized protein n=2 Tax=Streptococcus agalactiae TaxID=1311 RepID=Q8E173_STRA5|nr:hypothetical protein SAG0489 [Streptococcus agalactiae 2603V/R]ATZ82489.1 hypothetical protein CWQ22_02965 [Streptococcus agalactiae]AVH83407.1 hypothetical protein A6J68_11320 [Streptococcus sp. 'group B']AYY64284.1 hypothetical protein EGX70_05105 [Streptococcus sp. FDAARGOS_522]AYY69182.1 hypothetical protein EGX72_09455 [Streptococcus sp. FDAARGOS_521]AYZ05101.1 hypothetical protein EGX96_07955 [Streptococcus sp. FDAARGOS_520]
MTTEKNRYLRILDDKIVKKLVKMLLFMLLWSLLC